VAEQNITGEPIDEAGGGLVFPKSIVKRDDGVYANLARIESSEQFLAGVERVFESGYFFAGLDYGRFLELLYDYPPEKITAVIKALSGAAKPAMLRFAADIVVFTPDRRALYKSAKITEGGAEYIFEPVTLEINVDEPVFGLNEAGEYALVRVEKKRVIERTALSFDEFVAAMWDKGIRFGIDASLVREAILKAKTERLVFARSRQPTPGQDASLEEQMDGLYRDDTPKRLADGRVDLRQFKNRFPQVAKGTRLLKKIPRLLGITGWEVGGEPVEPPLPKDFDLADLSGPGTTVERSGEGEFIVASVDGFLNIDTATNRIAITEKITNRSGVSVRTTGDISLSCDEFEEYGEVQEKRVVEGKSMTLHADVFGSVISSGGRILLKQNLVGGSAANQNGDIVVEGLVSNAIVQAKQGKVVIRRAENSVIIGRSVEVESAVKCDILAEEEAAIGNAEGCAIAAKSVRIGTARARQERETIVSVLLPDLSGFDHNIAVARMKIGELEQAIAGKTRETEILTSKGEVRNYLVLSAKLKKNEIALTADQAEGLKRLAAQVAPVLSALAKLNGTIKAHQDEIAALNESITAQEWGKKATTGGVACDIGESAGGVLVRTVQLDMYDPLAELVPKQLRARLVAPAPPADRLMSDQRGAFSWRLAVPT
jgi:hypothetical protein